MPALISNSSTSSPLQSVSSSMLLNNGSTSLVNTRQVSATVLYSDDISENVVSLSPDLFNSLFPSLEKDLLEDNIFVVIHGINQNQSLSRKWTLYQVDLSPNHHTDQISLLSNKNKLIGGPPVNSRVIIQAVSPTLLDQLLVVCPPEIYDTFSSLGHDELMLQLLDSLATKIIRQGEYSPILRGIYKLCEPVDQGILTKKTKLVVVKDHHSNQHSQITPTNEPFEDLEVEIEKYISLNNHLNTDHENIPVTLRVKGLEEPVLTSGIIPSPELKDDPESRGFVGFEQLASIGCFSGDIVLLTTESGTQRHIRLFSYPEPRAVESDTIYLSPFLIFNLGNPSIIDVTLPLERKDTHDFTQYVKIAKEVTISRLASVVTTDKTLQLAFLSGLRTYFESCNRIVRNDDLIAVPIDTILAKSMYSIGGDDSFEEGTLPMGKPNDIAWFKITALNQLEGGSDDDFIIDPSQTRMIQSGIVRGSCITSTLPWKEFLSLPTFPSYEAGLGHTPNFIYASKLKQYLSASFSPLGASLNTTILVHSSKRGAGKVSVVQSVASQMGIHVFEVSGYSILGDTDPKTIGILRGRLERAAQISPCLVLIKHLDALAKKSEQDGKEGAGITSNLLDIINEFSSKENLVIVATVADVDKLSESVRAKFKFELEIGVPSEAERKEIFNQLCHKLARQPTSKIFGKSRLHFSYALRGDVSLETLALQSAGLTPPDLVSIVQTSKQKALGRFEEYGKKNRTISIRDLILTSGGIIKITPEDFEQAIGEARQKYSDSIGAPRIPNVSWEDVGGLEGVKKEILDTIEMPLKYPHLFSSGMKKRSGILFYGPPGTGKTLLAKAIATTFSLNFFSVKGPELLNMYIGESEANVRKVFQKARDARPCVVFFDELDSVAPKRGNQGDSGGVMDRIVSQLLAELDGMSGSGGEGVFVVGATNRPDLLDEALLRPGRFDKMLYLGISDTHEKQQTILEALTRKFQLHPTVSLEQISQKCPFTYTGADFYALCSDSMLNAMTKTANEVDEKIRQYNLRLKEKSPDAKEVSTRWWFENVATDADTDVLITEADFDKALRELIPSVSAEELQHYLRVRENFQGGKTKAKGAAAIKENGASSTLPTTPAVEANVQKIQELANEEDLKAASNDIAELYGDIE